MVKEIDLAVTRYNVLIAEENRYVLNSCRVYDDNALNTSDHVPIHITVKYDIQRYESASRKRYNWAKCDKYMYGIILDSELSINIKYNDISAVHHIDTMLDDVRRSISHAMDNGVPKSTYKRFRRPYWDDDLKAAHGRQKLLRNIWISKGRPRGRHFQSFLQYKLAKKEFRKMLFSKQNEFHANEFAKIGADFEMDSKSIWKYLRHRKGTQELLHSMNHENCEYSSPDDLRELWHDHFSRLLNEQNDEAENFDNEFSASVSEQVVEMLSSFPRDTDCTGVLDKPFSVFEVQTICKSMPNGKACGYDGLPYESLKYGTVILYRHLTKIFNGMVKYAYMPKDLKTSIIIPLYKGKGKPKDKVKSYRGVSLTPVLCKVYEKLLMSRLRPWLDQSNFPPALQHAGRKGCSSVTLSYALQEVVNHHCSNGGNVFGCLLDIEQAFDKISWDCLLFKLAKLNIKGKLWWIFRNFLLGSTSVVLINGEFSKHFEISRSIKQGGLLSMFFFTVAYYDIHQCVSGSGDSLQYKGRDVGSLTLADDTALLSNTVNGLQNMMNLAAEYGRKWRIVFSSTKTKCITFGEHRQKNSQHISQRQWYFNGNAIDEVQHYVHVGVKLCSYRSSYERIKDMAKKGYSIYGSLLGCGLNENGLSPLISSQIWHRISLPSMLYACELWNDIPKVQINMLEQVQKTIAKSIQGLYRRTHDEIVRGLLGWYTISGYIDKMKLLFIHTLVNMNSNSIVKHVFLNEMYKSCIFGTTAKSITNDIYNVINKYGLSHYLVCYLQGGTFPDRYAWKYVVKEQIHSFEELKWKRGLFAKEADRFWAIQPCLQPNILYSFMKDNVEHKKYWMLLIKMLTIVQSDERMLCTLCGSVVTDSVEHILLRCEGLLQERADLWDKLLDGISVFAESELFRKEDNDVIKILLGQQWSGYECDTQMYKLLFTVAQFIERISKHIL